MRLIDNALRCSLAASLAYLSPTQLVAARRAWRHSGLFTSVRDGSEYAGRLATDFTFAEQVVEPSTQASATIFRSEAGEACVAFRGSTSMQNFRSMFALDLVPLDSDLSIKVHRGYQEASARLYELLEPALERVGPERVVFTGHSYGGGTATLCALYHEADTLITFSAPRVGDAAFARTFDATPLGANTAHLVHDEDPVLRQNQPLWDALGYSNVGRVVRCSATQPLLLDTADAPPAGVAWNPLSHCRYLGTYMGPRTREFKWKLKPNYTPSRS